MRPHMRRLYWMHVGAGLLVASGALLGHLAQPAPPPHPAQADAVLGVLLVLAAINGITILPVRRAMLASPRRVFAVSAEAEPLLRAHLAAQGVVLARLVALAALGVAARFFAGSADWFWILEVVAALALLAMWPRHRAVSTLLGVPP